MTDEKVLLLEQPADGVARLILNRPESRNALSRSLRDALVEGLTTLAADDDVQAVILTGAGDVFCAGFDLKELSGGHSAEIFADAAHYHRVVHRFPKPLIAAVNGPALAGGMDLALMCDIRFGTGQARFGQPQIRFGVPAAYDLLASLCDDSTARYLCLTGNTIDAATAEARGILSGRFEDAATLQHECLNCATAIVSSQSGSASKKAFLARQPKLFEE